MTVCAHGVKRKVKIRRTSVIDEVIMQWRDKSGVHDPDDEISLSFLQSHIRRIFREGEKVLMIARGSFGSRMNGPIYGDFVRKTWRAVLGKSISRFVNNICMYTASQIRRFISGS